MTGMMMPRMNWAPNDASKSSSFFCLKFAWVSFWRP
jgi:hypothetical protein